MMKKVNLNEEQTATARKSALQALETFGDKNVLVVGDIGIDEYIKGEVKRISPEAPVPVLNVSHTECRLGLAANVAQNIVSLGGRCQLLSLVGSDDSAVELRQLLEKCGVEKVELIVDESRPTTKKTRVIHEAHHIVRIDFEKKEFISKTIEEKLLASFLESLPDCDLVVIEDYNKGVLSESFTQKVIQESQKKGKMVLVDPHETTPLHYYKGADLMTPNSLESFALLNISRDSILDEKIDPSFLATKMLEVLGSEKMVITQGKDGISIFDNNEWLQLPTQAKQVYDVTGAGDTVIAALSLGLASGLSLPESCLLANYAAGLVVAKVGSVPCEMAELKKKLSQ